MTPTQSVISALAAFIVATLIYIRPLMQLIIDKRRADLIADAARRSVQLGKETGDRDKLDGAGRFRIADDYLKLQIPSLSDEERRMAIDAAVGATPGVGESSKPPKVPS